MKNWSPSTAYYYTVLDGAGPRVVEQKRVSETLAGRTNAVTTCLSAGKWTVPWGNSLLMLDQIRPSPNHLARQWALRCHVYRPTTSELEEWREKDWVSSSGTGRQR